MYNSDMPNRADLPSSAQLLRSTLIAIGVAAALLVTVILPAEYGTDPTRIGSVLGLTEMGEIKQQLADEAALDAATAEPSIPDLTTAFADDQPMEEAGQPRSLSETSTGEARNGIVVGEPMAANEWADETVLVLAPGEAAEVKLLMKAGAVATFDWSVDTGHLNSALHGDGTAGEAISYRDGRAEASHAGELVAKFSGAHGWFWRNRSDETVTMTLKTKGEYAQVKRVL